MRHAMDLYDSRGVLIFIPLALVSFSKITTAALLNWGTITQLPGEGSIPNVDVFITQMPGCPTPSSINDVPVLGNEWFPPGTIRPRTSDELWSELQDECLLWNGSCSGDSAAVQTEFFQEGGTLDWLIFDQTGCFHNQSGIDCTPKLLSELEHVRDWMRTSECNSMGAKYASSHEDNSSEYGPVCCEECGLGAANVNVYYWPEPDVDTSCLSIIGNSVNPIGFGATTDGTDTYWGCVWSQTNSCDTRGSGYITARVETSDFLTWKVYLTNPWDPPSCPETDIPSTYFVLPTSSSAMLESHVLAGSAGHYLRKPISGAVYNSTTIATAVSGTFTLQVFFFFYHRVDNFLTFLIVPHHQFTFTLLIFL